MPTMPDATCADERLDDQPFPYLGEASLRRPILDALRRVIDPEVAMSIVDVGLIYQVTVANERVHVLMTMTSAACPAADLIMDDVERELDRVVPPEHTIELELCWEPPWTPAMITPRGRAQMGW